MSDKKSRKEFSSYDVAFDLGVQAGESMSRWGQDLVAGNESGMKWEEVVQETTLENMANLAADPEVSKSRADVLLHWAKYDSGYTEGQKRAQAEALGK